MQEKRRQQPREEETPKELLPCIHYQAGKCAKVSQAFSKLGVLKAEHF
jgi:hypothetical protein